MDEKIIIAFALGTLFGLGYSSFRKSVKRTINHGRRRGDSFTQIASAFFTAIPIGLLFLFGGNPPLGQTIGTSFFILLSVSALQLKRS